MKKIMILGKISLVLVLLASLCGFYSSSALSQTVNINANIEHQTIRGFGGHNGVGWINDLTPMQVDTAFGNGDDQMGLSIMRMRIDHNSSNWSLQVPAAHRASSQYGATLFATPWTPPAHMKSNNDINNGGVLLSQYYGAYTDHLLAFAQYMADNDAPLFAISLANEPDWHPSYESSEWSASHFVNYLASQGSRFGSLRVIAPESLNFKHSLSDPFLNNSSTSPHVDIIGGHLYGVSEAQDYPLARNMGKELWMTEHYTDSSNSANDWPLALDVGVELHQSMVANYNAYVWWYIRRSYGLLTEDGNISKRGYIMANYAKYVRPGYVRIGATASPYADVHVTAYKGPDNKFVIVAVNTATSDRKLNLNLQNVNVSSFTKYSTSSALNVDYGGKTSVSGGAASVWVDPQSVATFVSDGTSGDTGSQLWVELESLVGQGDFQPFSVQSDPAASGGEYIVWPDDGSNQILASASDEASGQVVIHFNLSQSANVEFNVRVNFPNADDDSFYYKLDSNAWRTQNNTRTSGWGRLTPVIFTALSAGDHRLVIERREDGAGLDRVMLSASAGSITAAEAR